MGEKQPHEMWQEATETGGMALAVENSGNYEAACILYRRTFTLAMQAYELLVTMWAEQYQAGLAEAHGWLIKPLDQKVKEN
jgi:hypothetical protein